VLIFADPPLARRSLRPGRADGKPLPAAHRRGAGLDGMLPVDLPGRKPLQHLVQRDAALEPGERRSETEVDAVAEGEVMIDPSLDVEAVAAWEAALVAVRGAGQQEDGALRRHAPSVVLDVGGEKARLDRR